MTSDAEHRASMASRVDGASLATGTPMPVEALGLAEVVKVDAFGDWIARAAGDVPGAPRSSLTAAVRQLPHASIPFVERVGDCAVGSVVIPDGGRRSAGWERFAFLVSGERLVVVEAGDACEGILRDAVKAASAAVDSISSPVGARRHHPHGHPRSPRGSFRGARGPGALRGGAPRGVRPPR